MLPHASDGAGGTYGLGDGNSVELEEGDGEGLCEGDGLGEWDGLGDGDGLGEGWAISQIFTVSP
jgi:hypothetical protein